MQPGRGRAGRSRRAWGCAAAQGCFGGCTGTQPSAVMTKQRARHPIDRGPRQDPPVEAVLGQGCDEIARQTHRLVGCGWRVVAKSAGKTKPKSKRRGHCVNTSRSTAATKGGSPLAHQRANTGCDTCRVASPGVIAGEVEQRAIKHDLASNASEVAVAAGCTHPGSMGNNGAAPSQMHGQWVADNTRIGHASGYCKTPPCGLFVTHHPMASLMGWYWVRLCCPHNLYRLCRVCGGNTGTHPPHTRRLPGHVRPRWGVHAVGGGCRAAGQVCCQQAGSCAGLGGREGAQLTVKRREQDCCPGADWTVVPTCEGGRPYHAAFAQQPEPPGQSFATNPCCR